MNGQAPKPQHEGEFRDKQKRKCDNTDAKPFERAGGGPGRRTIHLAARMVTANTMAVSTNSAALVPERGTSHSTRMQPSTKGSKHNGEIKLASFLEFALAAYASWCVSISCR